MSIKMCIYLLWPCQIMQSNWFIFIYACSCFAKKKCFPQGLIIYVKAQMSFIILNYTVSQIVNKWWLKYEYIILHLWTHLLNLLVPEKCETSDIFVLVDYCYDYCSALFDYVSLSKISEVPHLKTFLNETSNILSNIHFCQLKCVWCLNWGRCKGLARVPIDFHLCKQHLCSECYNVHPPSGSVSSLAGKLYNCCVDGNELVA